MKEFMNAIKRNQLAYFQKQIKKKTQFCKQFNKFNI